MRDYTPSSWLGAAPTPPMPASPTRTRRAAPIGRGWVLCASRSSAGGRTRAGPLAGLVPASSGPVGQTRVLRESGCPLDTALLEGREVVHGLDCKLVLAGDDCADDRRVHRDR